MKITVRILIIVFSCLTLSLKSENAPVTSVGIITNAIAIPGGVVVPVTVRNFVSIGAFTLTLRYQANMVTYVSAAPHASFTGMTVVNTVSGTLGKLVITWPQTPGGITLPDETHLLDLTFTWLSGSSALTWLYTGSNTCEYRKYVEGSYILLADSPKSSYYIKGFISNRGAPVTTAPVIPDAVPGTVSVPVTVTGFNAIGAMSLSLEFNQSVLTWQGCTPNPALSGIFNAGTQPGPNGKTILTISWFGLATLTDGSPVATISFLYANAGGSYSALDWLDTGSSCEYADAQANPLPDAPAPTYYHNGAVYATESPRVWLPVKTTATPGAIALPVLVSNYNNIQSGGLSFEYDPTVMSWSGYTPGSGFGNNLTVTDTPSGSKRKIMMTWADATPRTLADGSSLASLVFVYHSGTSALTWLVSDGIACRFNDLNGNACYDLPKGAHYVGGLVEMQAAPVTAAGQVTGNTGQLLTVPLNVYDFKNIGLFTLTLDYNPGVLTWQDGTLVPPVGGTFTAVSAGQGRIVLNWTGTAASLADGSDLVNLKFIYHGGSTSIMFTDDGNSCRYAESVASPPLYDSPQNSYYINGHVGPDPLSAAFSAVTTTGDLNTTFVLTDMTTGGPTAWNWTVSPSTYYFVSGTSASSQNPQVRFTTEGVYSVTLVASKGTSGSVMIRSGYLTTGTLATWTGLTSADWFNETNWLNLSVPTVTSYVVIPASAPNWPHLTGDLVLGGLCKNMTMNGASQVHVDGNLTINPGSYLDFEGTGHLFLGGSWSNAGLFNCGAGTVEFTGPVNASILAGPFDERFWKVVFAKTNATVTVNGNNYVIGTETP